MWGNGTKISYGNSTYDNYLVYEGEKQFKNNVKLAIDNGVNIIYWANEPNLQAFWIREVIEEMNVQDKVKLVVDLHDLDSIRRGISPNAERELFNCSDGLIYVTQSIQEMTNRLQAYNKPSIALYHHCNEDMIIPVDINKVYSRKGLVYEGGLNPPEDALLNQAFAYRNLYGIMKTLVDMGNELHIYCGNMSAFETYQNIGAIIHPPTIYNKMLEELSSYKYNIAIFNNEHETENQVNYTLANKEFDGLAAGIPTVACWCPETMRHIEKHKIGFTFSHINDIGDLSQLEDKYFEIMENIKVKQKELIMEHYIIRVENLYAQLLGLEGKAMPEDIKKINEFEYGKEDTEKVLSLNM